MTMSHPMKRAGRTALAAFVAAMIFGAAGAQAQTIEFGKSGKPTAIVTDTRGDEVPILVVADGAMIRTAPTRTAAKAGNAKFLDQYYLAATEATDGGRKFHLAATMDPATRTITNFVGWIDDADVMLAKQAIKENGIFQKALIINDWKTIGGELEIEAASARNGAGTRTGTEGQPYDEVAKLGLFQFHFVFKRHTTAEGQEFVLLGGRPNVTNVTKPAETILGWVPISRAQIWSTRQAVEFDKGTLDKRIASATPEQAKNGGGGVDIYEEEAELRAFLQGETELSGTPIEAVASEDTRVKSWKHNVQRFPLLESKKNDVLPAAGALYRVGYIGDQVYAGGGAASGSVGSNAETIADAQDKLNDLMRSKWTLDILFVIDSTGSMKSYFPAAADAVQQIVRQVKEAHGENGPQVRFSLNFFRDYPDEEISYLIRREGLTANGDLIAQTLRNETSTGGGDEPEAVFHGIDYAISAAANEVGKTGFRAMIVIGDKGNHRRDPRGHTTQTIAKRLGDEGYEFFSIQVVNPKDIERDADAALFRDQMREISRLLAPGTLNDPMGVVTNDPARIVQEITARSRKMAEDTLLVKERLDDIGRGEVGLQEIGRDYGVQVSRKISELMKAKGIDPAIFVEKSVQIFGRGWTTENTPEGTAQNRLVLLIDRPSLEQLIGILGGFLKEAPSQDTVSKVWTNVLKQQIGEANLDVNKTVAELIASHTGIPVRRNLLHKTLDEISRLSPAELAAVWHELEGDMHRIRALYGEKAVLVEEVVETDGRRTWKVSDQGTRKVWWKGDTDYAWIPANELP